MNVHIYLEDELGQKINSFAKLLGKSRNAIIREAIKAWVNNHAKNEWPASVLKFSGTKKFPDFEQYREDLSDAKEDPLA